jgi:hypothetical protein
MTEESTTPDLVERMREVFEALSRGDFDAITRFCAPDAIYESVATYMLRDDVPYEELGGDYFINREDQNRLTQRLVRQLERLGQRVTLEPALEAR